ncbi:hypothetical protein [Gracilimonas tropica]|uniref:hypothetical protein n=1 Tax=Gracilimonas tropica TaxID=454600 RepID=UPI00036072E3|nr:hypothetical protein [Gracilimonas tropica]
MKSYYQILFLLPILTFTPDGSLFAQNTKDEVEKSISRDAMPANALSQINQFWNEEKKADFYRQSNGEMISYEAKLDWNGYRYSIEFDAIGSLINVEQLIDIQELPEALRNTITEEIDKQYTRFKFTRIQRQFSASEEDENDEILENVLEEDFDDLKIRYEIEVDAQNKKELGSFELLFDENGNLIQKRKIVRRSLDNIW